MKNDDRDIFSFTDYRSYLKYAVENLKASNKKYSYEFCARKLGTKKSYLLMIISKKRHSSQDKIWKLADLLSLPSLERKYLMFLFLENTSKDLAVKKYFKEVVKSLRDRGNFRRSAPHLFNEEGTLYQNSSSESRIVNNSWLHMAIHTLTKLHDFRSDYQWMAERLDGTVTANEIKEVVQQMLKLNVLQEKDGVLSTTEYYYRMVDEVDNEEMLGRTPFLLKALSIIKNPNLYRGYGFQAGAVALSRENGLVLRNLYAELGAKIVALEKQEQQADWVFMFSNNYFNVTPRPENREK